MIAIPDAAARSLALDPSRSFIVQAPAGSGKTELLIQRFLALLATVHRPDEILAITFTRKAAAEMRSRLLLALERAQGSEPEKEHERHTWILAKAALERDRACGWQILSTPSLLTIQTIDSFNASLVRRMPWVSRFGGMPEIAEDPARLYREAAGRTLARVASAGRGSEEAALLLAHLDNRMERLQEMLVAMLQRRDQWLKHLAGDDHAAQRHHLEKALGDYVSETLQRLHGFLPESLLAPLLEVARHAANNLQEARPLAALAGLHEFPGTGIDDLPVWIGLADLLLTAGGELRRGVDKRCGFPPAKGPEAAMKEKMLSLLAEPAIAELALPLAEIRLLPPVVYPDDQWGVLQALVDLLKLAAAELRLVFAREAATDFAEVALEALRSLRENGNPSDLLLRLDSRLSHILVDEFQDTSHLQFALLELLTEGWQASDGRTLFVVGDPMQSIYRFREAEVGLFLRAQRRGIGSVPLERLVLSANFRSRAGIVAWVNETFSRIFPTQEEIARGAVCYAPAVPVLPAADAPAVEVHPQAGRDDTVEAQQVVARAQQALARGDSSVAILVRSRTHLSHILPALRGAGLRYLAREIDPLVQRPVARDIVSLTRALLHPGDRLAWLSILRAPWCGLSLSDLHLLCQGRRSNIPSLLADPSVLARLTPDGRSRVERTFAVLQRGQSQRGRVGLRRLVEGCWLALGGPACCDASALGDAERVFGLMEELERGGDLLPLELLEEGLRRLFAAPDAHADGRLQIMTIHKAKGLEFDTVILPGLGRQPRKGEKHLLRWLEHPECGLLIAPIEPRGGNGKDPIYEAIGRLEREKEELEVTRLIYVAATRARSHLHLLGHVGFDRDGEARPESGSLLDRLWPAVEGDFIFPAEECSESASESSRLSLPLRRLPIDWRLPEMQAAPLKFAAGVMRPSAARMTEMEEVPTAGWEGDAGRHVGTVVHHWLERIALTGPGEWPEERLRQIEFPVRRQLSALGIPGVELTGCLEKVRTALRLTIGSDRGRWLLSPREVAACEYPLSGVIGEELVHAVIDRTFIDEEGCRWIVDYKTSTPAAGEERSAFYAREKERYQGQLEGYAALFRSLEPERPVRAALYFPLCDGWCELALEEGSNECII